MTQYDGPVFVQPQEADDGAPAPEAERRRPSVANLAIGVVTVYLVLHGLRAVGFPGILMSTSPGTWSMPTIDVIGNALWLCWVVAGILPGVLGLLSLRRREDGRVRAGIAIGVGLVSVAWFVTERISMAVWDAVLSRA